MKNTSKKMLGAIAGVTLVLGSTMTAQAATPAGQDAAAGVQDSVQASGARTIQSTAVATPVVAGTFAYTQDKTMTNEQIASALRIAPQVLCAGQDASTVFGSADDKWAIDISGDVRDSFTLSSAELDAGKLEQAIMGCSCGGNKPDGKSAVNAAIAGVSLADIIDQAQPAESVNTVVFTSSDGYEVAIPLTYIEQRKSIIASQINGEDLEASVGGNNQLWLAATSARYYARNIVAISFESWDEAPAAPGTVEANDANTANPNVGVLSGKSA